jgi:hypothetical protein
MSFYSYDSVNKISIFLKMLSFLLRNLSNYFTNFVIKHIVFFYIELFNIHLSRALHYRIITKFYIDILYLGGVYCNFNLGCGRVISCPFSLVITKASGIGPCTLEKLVKKTKILKLTVVFLISCIKLSRLRVTVE